MTKGILGRKVGMTQLFDPQSGVVTPVTVIEAGPCTVLQVRTVERDGYEAVQLGFLNKPRPKKERRRRSSQASRAERGHVANIGSRRAKRRSAAGVELLAKANCEPKRFIRELRGPAGEYQIGQVLRADVLDGVPAVDVVGISKGRGFAGVMKRHNYAGQRATHGVKKVHRHPGSTGQSAFPGRTIRGRRMAGHYGHDRVTARNLRLVRVDAVRNVLLVRGAVPGPNGGYVIVCQTNKVG